MFMAKKKDAERPVISRNIIKYRKAKNLTQAKLAELSGLSTRMIAHYETNISNPPINNLLAIAEALDVSVLELIGQSKGPQADLFQDTDMRTLKKIMQIKELSKMDRATIYNIINSMLEKKSKN